MHGDAACNPLPTGLPTVISRTSHLWVALRVLANDLSIEPGSADDIIESTINTGLAVLI